MKNLSCFSMTWNNTIVWKFNISGGDGHEFNFYIQMSTSLYFGSKFLIKSNCSTSDEVKAYMTMFAAKKCKVYKLNCLIKA